MEISASGKPLAGIPAAARATVEEIAPGGGGSGMKTQPNGSNSVREGSSGESCMGSRNGGFMLAVRRVDTVCRMTYSLAEAP